MNTRKEKGITLIALVITIIILIILAGVSFYTVIGENGIFTRAMKQKEEQEIIDLTEELELKKATIAVDHEGMVGMEDYLSYLQEEGLKERKVTNIEKANEENTYIMVDDTYEYLLKQEESGNLLIIYQGKAEELKPRITSVEISNTTNSITLKVEAKRAEQYSFYIKDTLTEEYGEAKETNTEGEYTYQGLTHNTEYYIKVEVINKNGIVDYEATRTTEEMPNLQTAELQTSMNPNYWTNQDVTTKVTFNTNKDVSKYQLQYFQTTEELKTENLPNIKWKNYTEEGIVSKTNETIYFRLFDGTNSTSYISREVTIIDKEKPKITETTPTTDSVTITATDEASGIIGYTVTKDATEPDSFTELTESTKSLNKTIDNLIDNTTYYAWVKDEAGNISEKQEFKTPIAAREVTYHVDTNNQRVEKVKIGATCLSPSFTPAKDGWTFVGWRRDTTASSDVLQTETMGDTPITLYAVFSKQIVVTLYNDSTTKTEQKGTQYYNNGNKKNPTFTVAQNDKSTWTKIGWSTGTAANTDINYQSLSNTEIEQNITLYGKYQRTVTVKYNANGAGGATADSTGTAYYNSSGQTSNANIALRTNGFSKTNWTWLAWAEAKVDGTQRKAGYTYSGTSDVVYYAKWSERIYLTGNINIPAKFNEYFEPGRIWEGSPQGWSYILIYPIVINGYTWTSTNQLNAYIVLDKNYGTSTVNNILLTDHRRRHLCL